MKKATHTGQRGQVFLSGQVYSLPPSLRSTLPSCSDFRPRRALPMAAGRGDAASMVAVGLVWGATNALMRRGALVWDRRARACPAGNVLRRWAELLLTWQYSAPFAANLSASAAFFALLGAAPISVAVPVTNAVTFAATAAAAAALGERVRPAPAVLGTTLIVLGVWVCIS